MTTAYERLLEATLTHLEELKARGAQHVTVHPESLKALTSPAPARRAAAASRPGMPYAAPSTALPSAQPPPTPQPAAQTQVPLVKEGLAKQAALNALRNRVLPCVKCDHLAKSRKTVVFGVGNPEADLMFVGEAPGADEDLAGEPFVGKAGQLLDKIIQAMGLTRELVFVANILKCRPDTPGQTAGNRKPTSDEMHVCIPYLQEQIDIIQPKVLVALGATAVEGLLGKTQGITRLRGNWQEYRGIPLMPTYHPAYLLRNQSIDEKRKVWEDMLQVMERLNLPISEKQRRFFQRPG